MPFVSCIATGIAHAQTAIMMAGRPAGIIHIAGPAYYPVWGEQ